MLELKDCPCQSQLAFAQCCGRFIKSSQNGGTLFPPTAEALMRSRYTAYVLHDEMYLLQTWHMSSRPGNIDFSGVDSVTWTGLQIVNTEGGGLTDDKAMVEFIADYEVSGVRKQMHERSRFVREDGRWYYLDGKVMRNLGNAADGKVKKTGRNEPCPCGSGKKYKRCCGA